MKLSAVICGLANCDWITGRYFKTQYIESNYNESEGKLVKLSRKLSNLTPELNRSYETYNKTTASNRLFVNDIINVIMR